MKRSLAGVAFVLALVAAGSLVPAAVAQAATLSFVKLSSRLGPSVESLDSVSGTSTTLLGAGQPPKPFFLSTASWSGDGTSLLISAFSKSQESASSLAIYAIPAAGGGATLIQGTEGGYDPVGFSDGQTVAFMRARGQSHPSSSLWLIGIDGSGATQLTPWRSNGYDIPTSVSPDGSTLAVTRVTRNLPKPPHIRDAAMLVDLATGHATPVGPSITAAAFSPDGTRLAVVKERVFAKPRETKTAKGSLVLYGESDLYVKDLLTGAMTRITSGPAIDGLPTWDPSGQRLAFVREQPTAAGEGSLFGLGDAIYEVNADGSCLTRVLHEPQAAFLAPAWRPGPENGAGPMAC